MTKYQGTLVNLDHIMVAVVAFELFLVSHCPPTERNLNNPTVNDLVTVSIKSSDASAKQYTSCIVWLRYLMPINKTQLITFVISMSIQLRSSASC